MGISSQPLHQVVQEGSFQLTHYRVLSQFSSLRENSPGFPVVLTFRGIIILFSFSVHIKTFQFVQVPRIVEFRIFIHDFPVRLIPVRFQIVSVSHMYPWNIVVSLPKSAISTESQIGIVPITSLVFLFGWSGGPSISCSSL